MSENPDLKTWMDERGLKASDIAQGMRVDDATVRNWRSQGVPERRRPHVERYMREWTPTVPTELIDDAVQRLRDTDAIILTPSAERIDRWDRASRIAGAKTLKDWINDGLDSLASQELGSIDKEQQFQHGLSMVADAPGNLQSPSTHVAGAQTGQIKYPKGKRRTKEG